MAVLVGNRLPQGSKEIEMTKKAKRLARKAVTKAKKKIVRREYAKADVKELRSLESQNAIGQNSETDEKSGKAHRVRRR